MTLMFGGFVSAYRVGVEIQHRDILRYAALDGQMHLEIDGTEIEIEVLGVDHPHHAFGCGLHGRGIECVGFRRDQRVYSVGELLYPLCASCGACVGGCIC